jgi:hypothetical protein
MCWLANYRGEVPSSEEISLMDSIIVDWFMAPRKWGFNLKTKSTNYPDHGHHGNPPPTRKIPMVEPGIEPGTSLLVVRSSDHQTTRLVSSGLRWQFRNTVWHIILCCFQFIIQSLSNVPGKIMEKLGTWGKGRSGNSYEPDPVYIV